HHQLLPSCPSRRSSDLAGDTGVPDAARGAPLLHATATSPTGVDPHRRAPASIDPVSPVGPGGPACGGDPRRSRIPPEKPAAPTQDRKSTRLNSSHVKSS